MSIERSTKEAKVQQEMTRYVRREHPFLFTMRSLIFLLSILLTCQVSSSAAQAFLTCSEPKPLVGGRLEVVNVQATAISRGYVDPLATALSSIARSRLGRPGPETPAAALMRNIRVVDALSPNAYTSPTGELILTNSLLRAITDPAQLSFVVAHEIGHAMNRESSYNTPLESELAADDFATTVLTHAGITECAGIAALTTLGSDHANSLPSVVPRLKALRAKAPTCSTSGTTGLSFKTPVPFF
jgi:hypothetical protein